MIKLFNTKFCIYSNTFIGKQINYQNLIIFEQNYLKFIFIFINILLNEEEKINFNDKKLFTKLVINFEISLDNTRATFNKDFNKISCQIYDIHLLKKILSSLDFIFQLHLLINFIIWQS